MRGIGAHTALLVLLSFTRTVSQVISVGSVSPVRADTGAVVSIHGLGFSAVPGQNIVRFGAVSGEVLTASTTDLQTRVPASATYAPVTVTAIGRSASSSRAFSTTFPGNRTFGPTSFDRRLDYASVSLGPGRLAVGDMDGDGRSDLVIAEYQGNACAVLRNFTSSDSLDLGSFIAVCDEQTGYLPVSVAIADIDGDGLLDIVLGHQFSPFVSIFRNISLPGTMLFEDRIDIPASPGFLSVAVADIDGDGRPDLAVANRERNTIVIFPNAGEPGHIVFSPAILVGSGEGPVQIVSADLDNDGRYDIMFGNHASASVSCLRNLSSPGSFAFASPVSVQVAQGPSSIAVGDLNEDGILDLVATSPADSILSIVAGSSTPGSISFSAPSGIPVSPETRSAALADVDGDGRVDVTTVGSLVDSVTVYRNVSQGETLLFDPPTGFCLGSPSLGILVADLTGNGKPELAAAHLDELAVSVFRNVALPPPRIDVSPGVLSFPDVAVGDSVNLSFSIRDLSPATLTISSAWTGPGPFHAVLSLPLVIAGRDSIQVPVVFRPQGFGLFADTLRLFSNGGDTSVVLFGASPAPALRGLPDSVNFGVLPVYASETRTFPVMNPSVNPLHMEGILAHPPFSSSVSDSLLRKGDTSVVLMTFLPESAQLFNDSLTYVTNGIPARIVVTVRGEGLNATSLELASPWNLVSVPRLPSTLQADSLFIGKTGYMFAFRNETQDYAPVTTLATGSGYWVKFGVPETLSIVGASLDSIVVNAAREGWVVIGTITRPVGLSSLVPTPAGSIVSSVFRYNRLSQLYEPASELRPGEGYWVKLRGPCRLVVR